MFRMSTVNLLSLSFPLSKTGAKIFKTVELTLHRWLGILIWYTLWASHPGQVIPTSLSKTLIKGKAPCSEPVYYLFGQETRDNSSLLWLKKTLWASHPGQEIPTSLSKTLKTGNAPWSGNCISAAVRNCVTLFWLLFWGCLLLISLEADQFVSYLLNREDSFVYRNVDNSRGLN